LLWQFGQAVTYSPIDGPAVAITRAIVEPETTERVDSNGIAWDLRKRQVTIGTDPDSDDGGVADVSVTATITIDGEEWPIVSIESRTDSHTIINLERPELVEHAHAGFRRAT